MNNNRIIFARGETAAILSKTNDKVQYGQPIYANDTNYLFIGNKKNGKDKELLKNLKPITVRDLVGYFDDNSYITSSRTMRYSIEPQSDRLKIESVKKIDINVTGKNSIIIDDATALTHLNGKTKVDDLVATAITGNNHITIGVDNDSKNLVIKRSTHFNKDIQFNSDASVKSKFIVYGGAPTGKSLIVDADATDFLTVEGATRIKQSVKLNESISEVKNINASGIISAPTFKTSNGSVKVEMATTSNNSYFKITKNQNEDHINLNKSSATFNVNSAFNNLVTLSGGLKMPSSSVADIASANIDTLTVKTLVINS